MTNSVPKANSILDDLRGTRLSDHLDMIRGLAAVAVLYCHVRVLFLSSDPAVMDRMGSVNKALYILSAYGHPSVMLFFVLSGLLIANSVLRSVRAGRWDWKRYLLQRATRLYVVLIPGLLLTLFWDALGLPAVREAVPASDTGVAIIKTATIQQNSGLTPFLGNLAFLQTIRVPTLGSNSALWSLANEFWYYLIFPCLCLLALRTSLPTWQRIAYGVAGAALLAFVGGKIALYFSIWLLGAALCVAPLVPRWRNTQAGRVACLLSGAALVGVLALIGLRKLPQNFIGDASLGVAFAAFLYCLLHQTAPSRAGLYARIAKALSGCSYTLYIVHLPLLIFLRNRLTYEAAWMPTAASWLRAAVILVGAFGYAYLLAQLTEARTETVRRWLSQRLTRPVVPVKAAQSK